MTNRAMRWIAAIALGSLHLACSAPPGVTGVSPGEPEATAPSVLRTSAVCPQVNPTTGEVSPQLYVFFAMTWKLAHFPDFAAEVGLDAVTSCEEGDRYIEGYARYAAANPSFDFEQNYDFSQDDAPPEPATKPDVQKIFFGTAALNNPVVQIGFSNTPNTFGFNGNLCSGTFIAKNWILTAAHCITFSAVDHCIQDGISPYSLRCEPTLSNWAQWEVVFKKDTPVEADQFVRVPYFALAYIHPLWVGTDPTQNPDLNVLPISMPADFSEHDLALLYIGDDGSLPPNVEQDGAKRLSIVEPQPIDWDFQFFGWGLPKKPASVPAHPEPNLELWESTVQPVFAVPNELLRSNVITGTTQNGSIQSGACAGDSGGPLMRMNVPIRTNPMNQVNSVQVIAGVTSTGLAKTSTICTMGTLPTGSITTTFTRVDTPSNFDFIESRIRRWNGNPITEESGFRCRRRPVDQDGPDLQVAECWGPPCTTQSQCTPQNLVFCSHTEADFSFCPTCGGSGGCGCLVGQCIPDPRNPTPPGWDTP